MNIRPGATSWTEVSRLLEAWPQGELAAKEIRLPLEGQAQAALYVSVDHTHVGRIYVSFPKEKPFSVGWLVERYGAPCGVSIYARTGLLTLRYPNLLANVWLREQRLDTFTPVMSIQFIDPQFHFRTQPDLCIDNITDGAVNRPWRGFTSIRHYGPHPVVG
jgi:hypothetical protein